VSDILQLAGQVALLGASQGNIPAVAKPAGVRITGGVRLDALNAGLPFYAVSSPVPFLSVDLGGIGAGIAKPARPLIPPPPPAPFRKAPGPAPDPPGQSKGPGVASIDNFPLVSVLGQIQPDPRPRLIPQGTNLLGLRESPLLAGIGAALTDVGVAQFRAGQAAVQGSATTNFAPLGRRMAAVFFREFSTRAIAGLRGPAPALALLKIGSEELPEVQIGKAAVALEAALLPLPDNLAELQATGQLQQEVNKRLFRAAVAGTLEFASIAALPGIAGGGGSFGESPMPDNLLASQGPRPGGLILRGLQASTAAGLLVNGAAAVGGLLDGAPPAAGQPGGLRLPGLPPVAELVGLAVVQQQERRSLADSKLAPAPDPTIALPDFLTPAGTRAGDWCFPGGGPLGG